MKKNDAWILLAPAIGILMLGVAVRLTFGGPIEDEPIAVAAVAAVPMPSPLTLDAATYSIDLDDSAMSMRKRPVPIPVTDTASVEGPRTPAAELAPAPGTTPTSGRLRLLLELDDGTVIESPESWRFSAPAGLDRLDVDVTLREATS